MLEANPNFWGKEPLVKKIIIRYFADATTMRLALEKGEIDLAYKTMNPSDIADLSKSTKLTTYKLPGPYIRYLCFETSESVFKDKKLRQAVAALINRPEIVRKVFLGQNSPLYSMVPKGMIYHGEDYKTIWGDGNVAAAERILKSLGYSASKPFQFDLWYTPTHYGDTEVNVAEVMKAQLEKTPLVKVTLKSAEWATYKEQWKQQADALLPAGLVPRLHRPRQLYCCLCRHLRLQGHGDLLLQQGVGRPVHEGTDEYGRQRAQGRVHEDPEDVDGRKPHGPHLPGRPVRLHPEERDRSEDRAPADLQL